MTTARTLGLAALVLAGTLGCKDATTDARKPEGEGPGEGEVADPMQTVTVTYDAPEQFGPKRVETIGDHRLEVRLELDQSRFMASEPVYAQIVFEADAEIEVELSWMGRNRLGRPENYRVHLRDPGGEALAVPDAGMGMGGNSWVARVGEEPARQRLFLPNWYETLGPGRHVLVVETTVPVRASTDGAWEQLALALEAEVEVTPDDPDALGELIGELAVASRGDDSDGAREAMQQLAAIDDPRVVGAWLALASFPGYERRFAAIRALGEIDDPRALAALVQASRTRADELPADRYTTEALREQSAGQLRLAAAQVLAERPEPEALEALLKLESDPEYGVRLTVAQRAAKLDDARAAPVLRRLAADDNEMVRGEAQRLLRERGLGAPTSE